MTVWINQEKNFTRESIKQISDDCFELSKQRLFVATEKDITFGRSIYNDVRDRILQLVIEFDPISFGFSVSLEPSLHFIVRFRKDITLFFETYIDFEEGLESYIQIYEGKDLIHSFKDTLDDSMFYIEEILQEKMESRTMILPKSY